MGSWVKEASYTRLCSTKNIITVNGQFPRPTIYAKKGETIIVDVYNKGKENITIHWHGVSMPRYPWIDGPKYITQCPIQPRSKFSQKIILSFEEGTLWWHAHSDWTQATIHGAIIVYPKNGTKYPFPKPNVEVPIILGQWWKSDVNMVRDEALATGADPNASDSLLINGQPGDLFPCSKSGTFKLTVDHGKTYLLRIINAALHEALFFSITKHKMTVVGTDAKTYSIIPEARNFYDNTTTTAIVQYRGYYTPSSPPSLPHLPAYNDTNASVQVMAGLRSLADAEHPCNVPLSPSTKLIYTVSMNSFLCPNNSCAGPNGTRSPQINFLAFHTSVRFYHDIIPLEDTPPHASPWISFYVVGWGFGNFDKIRTHCATIWWILPLEYHLRSTKGWATIRFEASNPGVWFMHCHVERHQTWGMETAFIVKNGKHPKLKCCLRHSTCHHVEATKN
ncbi:putative laccase-9 [Vitis vinifera]|uniref:laccase n=1 Tax=Vitis vinifera TaxID=29760 RepID=A0A438CV08_VITVI|nr:putative laccase-9 [Vitis vinifera]